MALIVLGQQRDEESDEEYDEESEPGSESEDEEGGDEEMGDDDAEGESINFSYSYARNVLSLPHLNTL